MIPSPIIDHETGAYEDPYPSDAYFGCLDGHWNRDGDGHFGELFDGNHDGPDVEAEVHVGRIPVESPREVRSFLRTLLLYERPRHRDYQDRVAYVGESVGRGHDPGRHYHALQERCFAHWSYSPRYFTAAHTHASASDVFRALTEGVGVVCHDHHALPSYLALPVGRLNVRSVEEIQNAERPFVLFSNGCLAGLFTEEGVAEKLLLSEVGGAALFVGSTGISDPYSETLERIFWAALLLDASAPRVGEALSRVRADVFGEPLPEDGMPQFGRGRREGPQMSPSCQAQRLALTILGDPAMPLWRGRPVRTAAAVRTLPHGRLRVTVATRGAEDLRVVCHQAGRWGAHRESVAFPAGVDSVVIPAVIGNGAPLRVTVLGSRCVPARADVPDPVPVHVKDVRLGAGGVLEVALHRADDLRVLLPDNLREGPWLLQTSVKGWPLRLSVPVLDGGDVGYVKDDVEVRLPGFDRMGARGPKGLPLVIHGAPRVVETRPEDVPASDTAVVDIATATRETSAYLTWPSMPGWRWLVEEVGPEGRRLRTPIPLANPVFHAEGLHPFEPSTFVVSRLDAPGESVVHVQCAFPWQAGYPKRIGAGITSVQALEHEDGPERVLVFSDEVRGVWMLHGGGALRPFATVRGGARVPIVANLYGGEAFEVVAVSRAEDARIDACDHLGHPLEGFPVSFPEALPTPPLVGNFDGEPWREILVVGDGGSVCLVKPDGRVRLLCKVGAGTRALPVAANFDDDPALEIVVRDGQGDLWLIDQGGEPFPGFPVRLGAPAHACPLVADLDGDGNLEIVAVTEGSTRIVLVDPRTGRCSPEFTPPRARSPRDEGVLTPALARLGEAGRLSVVFGTSSNRLFAFEWVEGELCLSLPTFSLRLPARARGIAAVDVDDDGIDELFLTLEDGQVWGMKASGVLLPGFPLHMGCRAHTVPLLEDLDGDGDLELVLGAEDGMLRVWDLPYRKGPRPATWPGLQGGAGLPGTPGGTSR